MDEAKKSADYRRGVGVLIALAVLTGVEYVVGVATQLWVVLVVLGVIKAAVVLQYFMHIGRLASDDGGH